MLSLKPNIFQIIPETPSLCKYGLLKALLETSKQTSKQITTIRQQLMFVPTLLFKGA